VVRAPRSSVTEEDLKAWVAEQVRCASYFCDD
jgi:hypothetical protein